MLPHSTGAFFRITTPEEFTIINYTANLPEVSSKLYFLLSQKKNLTVKHPGDNSSKNKNRVIILLTESSASDR